MIQNLKGLLRGQNIFKTNTSTVMLSKTQEVIEGIRLEKSFILLFRAQDV